MKNSISKEMFIDYLEMDLNLMSSYVEAGNKACFDVVQREYSALVHFAYVNDLFTDEEYARYRPYEFCMFWEFSKGKS